MECGNRVAMRNGLSSGADMCLYLAKIVSFEPWEVG